LNEGEKMLKKRFNHGGIRKGAGRKALPESERKTRVTFRLSPDVAEFLRAYAVGGVSQAELIEIAVKKVYPAFFKAGR
jgi:hypothetical protein